jgi:hypothetical protein
MLNFKIKQNTDVFLEKVGGTYSYNFQGTSYEITEESLKLANPRLQQSFGRFVAKNLPRKRKLEVSCFQSEANAKISTGKTFLPTAKEHEGISKFIQVKKELLRIATVEKIVEEKLDMPKVFRALLTEPYSALEHKKKSIETSVNLTLFVDANVAYHNSDFMSDIDVEFHNTLIKAAESIKGVNVFYSNALYNMEFKGNTYTYYTDLYKVLPANLKRKVIVFTQGCGSMGDYKDMPKEAVHFCTGFSLGCNCGCGQIEKARRGKQIMHYGITNIEKLKKLML